MRPLPLRFALALLVSVPAFAAAAEEGFTSLMDGSSFAGWTPATENTATWKIEDGAFVTRGPRCHLFYTGDPVPFKNFELKVEVMTEPGANGGIYFHTRYQETNWPQAGFETQVNNTQSDWKKTGSLYDLASVGFVAAQDNVWWTQHIIVEGNTVTVKVNDTIVMQYKEPAGAQAGAAFERKLGTGTFALQAHDPKSVVRYRHIRVKRLPD
ncbi:hypothetical protein Verru16b_02692 [Lacunisphaera limnophila]|uniref:3-keto-alpha-glucoside-1,2-lyase/3-keto-2-hydroxy-glucal hydratase domain-containing protein n=1 Tax=Lacunisphaera limnophila TaxID=1838286 RepID=A0A1D8AXJ4_9BACT|nr:DUF1080 domain-containing protein [Lacunisphaera limnophila]AOS45608.1 hypothetical protein Verru16b_02692 [Lacunisphaera limnophila]